MNETFSSFAEMLASLKPQPQSADFWREMDRLQALANSASNSAVHGVAVDSDQSD